MFRRPQFIFLVTLLLDLANGLLIVAVPLIASKRLDASAAMLGCYGFAPGLTYVLFSAWSGRLSDRWGRRPLLAVSLLAFAVAMVGAIVVQYPVWFLIPLALGGAAQGMLWPTVEAALVDGLSSGQIKRALGVFNFVWVGALSLGAVLGGIVYNLNPDLAFILSAVFAALMLGLLFLPRAMEIAPWRVAREFAHHERVAPARRALFIRLALFANLATFVAIGAYRGLLPEYTADTGIVGWRYGLLAGGIYFGMFFSNGLWMLWHGWHYSLRFLIGIELLAAALLSGLALDAAYPLLVLMTLLLGLTAGATYYASLYYGMEQSAGKGEHGSNHETIIGLGLAGGPLIGGWIISLSDFSRAHLPFCALVFVGVVLLQVRLSLRQSAGGATGAAGADFSSAEKWPTRR